MSTYIANDIVTGKADRRPHLVNRPKYFVSLSERVWAMFPRMSDLRASGVDGSRHAADLWGNPERASTYRRNALGN